MILQIFRPPADNETLMSCKLGDINDAISFEYEKYFCGVGSFMLELPANSVFAERLAPNILLYDKQYDDCFIIRNIKSSADKLTVTGNDLNGLLRDRLVLQNEGEDASDGHVIIAGTTEYCVKHYVEKNLVSADQNERNYPRFGIAEDKGRGLASAHGYAAPESVEDVIRELCEDGLLGYRVRLDTGSTGGIAPLFIFDVSERVDRSAEQKERNRVIFSIGMGNVTAIEREVGVTAYRNALWCETGGEPVFQYENAENVPASWGRREEYVSISVADKTDGEEIAEAASKTMADKFAQTDSLSIEAGNPLDYGEVYNLGDIVTVYDKARNVQLDTWISAVKIVRKSGEFTVSLTLGEAKPKLLDGYQKQSDLLKKNQRDYPAAVQSAGASLFEYEVLSDGEVKYNGTKFTFTAGSDGRISAVTTDSGEEFSPKLGGSTDISAHNAAFMAVAMLSRMAKAEPITDTLTETCLYRYNCDSVELSGNNVLWANQASGASDKLTFENSSVVGKYVDTTGGTSFGSLSIDLTTTAINSKPFTLYAVVQAKGTGSAHCISFRNSVPAGEDLLVVDGKWAYQYSYESEPTVFEDCNADTLSAIAIVKKTTSKVNVYINGTLVLENSSGARPMKGTIYFGKSATGTTDDSGFKFYDFAAADHEQSAEQVLTNLKYLMKKYKIGQ